MNKHTAPFSLSALLLAGCGGGGSNGVSSSGSGSSAPAAPVTAPAAPLSVSVTAPSGLTATLAEDRSTVPVGGSVTYTLTLKNNTSQPISFQSVGFGISAIMRRYRL